MKSVLIYSILAIALLSGCSKSDSPEPEETTPPVVVPPTEKPVPPTFTSFAPLTAKANDEITLTGTGFGNDSTKVKVTFSVGKRAILKSVTPTQIVLYAPASTDIGKITLTLNDTTTLTSKENFTPIASPASDYVVKSVGISRIMIAADVNDGITIAELFGGGNRVILKKGTGNTMDVVGTSIGLLPAEFLVPEGNVPFLNAPIDNGNTSLDTSGTAMVVKLKGFDKKKTGYNQLNLVMHKYLWVLPIGGWAGFETNLAYLKINIPEGKKSTEYGNAFLRKIFSGNISVSSVELAKPKSEKPYITRDQIVSNIQAVTNINEPKGLTVRFRTLLYSVNFTSDNAYAINVGKPLKFEWVNANNATISKESEYVYTAKFNNMKAGGDDQVVEPADSVNKVFLRITGFNPELTGFNQLRLFIGSDSFYNGELRLIFNDTPLRTPDLAFFKEVYRTGQFLNCGTLMPSYKHY